nr:hypothetical protein Itr_chr15CG08100 [Ipomoea trifida]
MGLPATEEGPDEGGRVFKKYTGQSRPSHMSSIKQSKAKSSATNLEAQGRAERQPTPTMRKKHHGAGCGGRALISANKTIEKWAQPRRR